MRRRATTLAAGGCAAIGGLGYGGGSSVPVRRGVQLTRQLSNARRVEGANWGWDRSGIWVDQGCRAEFTVR